MKIYKPFWPINHRLIVVLVLGFSSGLPFALLGSTLQAWFASQGMTVFATSMLSMLSIPYILRMFMGPVVDRFTLFASGKRKSWILTSQISLIVGFNCMALLTPKTSPMVLAILAAFLAAFSAIQDLVIDAHRIEYLPKKQHGIGASLAVLGYRLALLIASGFALIFAHNYGWKLTYQVMGVLLVPGVLAVYLSQEPNHDLDNKQKANHTRSSLWLIKPFQELIQRQSIIMLFIFIFLYKLAEAFTSNTSGIMMPFLITHLGFSLDTVGFVNKIVAIFATLAGGLVSGLLLLRWSLYRALLVFGLMQAFTNLFFVWLAMVGKNTFILALAIISDNFSAGLGATALVALLMRVTHPKYTATQFSIFIAFATIPRAFSGPIGVTLQHWFGWIGLYEISFLLALLFLPFLKRIREPFGLLGERMDKDNENHTAVQRKKLDNTIV